MVVRRENVIGSERLPYKQRVGGSTPSAPTTRKGKSKQNPEVRRLRDFLLYAWPDNNIAGPEGPGPAMKKINMQLRLRQNRNASLSLGIVSSFIL